jgi:poly(3-hydroxybutyrate) depolymerase
MTIEGEKDDITGTGQCGAAHALCSGIPASRKVHFECPKVGHYGIFNGSRFRCEIAPRMAKFMRIHDPCADGALTIAQLEHMARSPPRGGHARDLRELEALAFSFPTR